MDKKEANASALLKRCKMRLYVYGALFALFLATSAYIVHKIREDVRTDIALNTANTAAEIQGVKDEIRNVPTTGTDVINSLRKGAW